jgi:hypothetical protein
LVVVVSTVLLLLQLGDLLLQARLFLEELLPLSGVSGRSDRGVDVLRAQRPSH